MKKLIVLLVAMYGVHRPRPQNSPLCQDLATMERGTGGQIWGPNNAAYWTVSSRIRRHYGAMVHQETGPELRVP